MPLSYDVCSSGKAVRVIFASPFKRRASSIYLKDLHNMVVYLALPLVSPVYLNQEDAILI